MNTIEYAQFNGVKPTIVHLKKPTPLSRFLMSFRMPDKIYSCYEELEIFRLLNGWELRRCTILEDWVVHRRWFSEIWEIVDCSPERN